jgi:Fe-S cluster assembly protein SufD
MLPRAKLKSQKQDAAESWLDGRALPAGKDWITRARGDARARLLAMGLPMRRDEYWRYTDPRRLLDATAPEAELRDAATGFDAGDCVKLVFVDGLFDARASDPLALAGVEIGLLADAAQADLHWARDLFGTLEARAQSPVERPLASLNTAFATQGVLIRVTGKAAKPVSLIYRRSVAQADALVHHVLRLEDDAELTLLEDGAVAARSNHMIEAELGAGATLHHVRAKGRDHGRVAVSHLFAALGAGAQLKSFTLTANGALIRNEAIVWLDGAGGSAHVAGVAVGDGAFHNDDTVFITHGAQGCESRQVYQESAAARRSWCVPRQDPWSNRSRSRPTAIRFQSGAAAG